MGKNKRFVASGGLAFTEERDMRKLSGYAEKGWLLDTMGFMGYKLRKGEPRKLSYSFDVRELNADERDDYFRMFESAGWSHVCSAQYIHFFLCCSGDTADLQR